MTAALMFYVTVWTAIGALFAFGVVNTVEAWNNRHR